MKLPRRSGTALLALLLRAAALLLAVGRCARAFSPSRRATGSCSIPARSAAIGTGKPGRAERPRGGDPVRLRSYPSGGERRRSPGRAPFGVSGGVGSSSSPPSRPPPSGLPAVRGDDERLIGSDAWFEEQERRNRNRPPAITGTGGSPNRPSSVSPPEWNIAPRDGGQGGGGQGGYYGGGGGQQGQQQGRGGGGGYYDDGGERDYRRSGNLPRLGGGNDDRYRYAGRGGGGGGGYGPRGGRYDDGGGYGYNNRGREPIRDSFLSFAACVQTALVGAAVGTWMVFPVTAYHYLFFAHGGGGASALTTLAQWEWELLASAVEGAWFATIYRNLLKRDGLYDRGLHLRIVAGFVVLKTFVQVDVPKVCRSGPPLETGAGLPLACAVPRIQFAGLDKLGAAEVAVDFAEAVVLFGAVALAMNWLLDRRWIRPYGY